MKEYEILNNILVKFDNIKKLIDKKAGVFSKLSSVNNMKIGIDFCIKCVKEEIKKAGDN